MTTRTYTATHDVASVMDPLGRVTTATYDPAGRQLSQTDPEGHTITWTYDKGGRETSKSFDGKLIAAIERDLIRRSVVITDYTRDNGVGVEHVLGFDRRGLLTSRTRGTQGMSWEYDGDGNRTGFPDTHGNTTTYARDAAGQVTAINNSLLGEATFAHDASGRIIGATAGDLVQDWAYRNGALTEHTRTNTKNPGGVAAVSADVTMIGRDHDGRITALTRDGVATQYGYDSAGQLTTATTNVTSTTSAMSFGDQDSPTVMGCYLGARYKRIVVRRGKMKAIVAVEHSILTAIWHMLAEGECYHDPGSDFFTQKDPTHTKNNAIRRLQELGYNVTLSTWEAA